MRCPHQVSLATWRLRVYGQLVNISYRPNMRLMSTTVPNPTYSHNKPTKPTMADNSTSSFNRPSQKLPQSPLMKTSLSSQPKIRKKLATEEDYARLQFNPWAQALASDTRTCVLTGARIPRRLMGRWGFVRHPETDKLYLLPVELFLESLGWRPASTTKKVRGEARESDGEATKENDFLNLHHCEALDRKQNPDQPMALFIAYLSNPIRRMSQALERMKKPAVARLLPFRWRHPQGPFTAREEKRMGWIKDMPSLLSRHMRADTAKRLKSVIQVLHNTEAPHDILRTIEMQEISDLALSDALTRLEAVEQMEQGVVLVLGGTKPSDDGTLSTLAMLPQVKKRVPVFDLTQLLSESDLTSLRQVEPQFQGLALFYKPNTAEGVTLVISLWKLQRYLAE